MLCEWHTVRNECTAIYKQATVNWHHSLVNVLLTGATSLLSPPPEGPPERRKSVSGLLHQLVRSVSVLFSPISQCVIGGSRGLSDTQRIREAEKEKNKQIST
jgi:hypothetical protein